MQANKILKNKMRPLGPLMWVLEHALGVSSLHANSTTI